MDGRSPFSPTFGPNVDQNIDFQPTFGPKSNTFELKSWMGGNDFGPKVGEKSTKSVNFGPKVDKNGCFLAKM